MRLIEILAAVLGLAVIALALGKRHARRFQRQRLVRPLAGAIVLQIPVPRPPRGLADAEALDDQRAVEERVGHVGVEAQRVVGGGERARQLVRFVAARGQREIGRAHV